MGFLKEGILLSDVSCPVIPGEGMAMILYLKLQACIFYGTSGDIFKCDNKLVN